MEQRIKVQALSWEWKAELQRINSITGLLYRVRKDKRMVATIESFLNGFNIPYNTVETDFTVSFYKLS